MKGDLSAGRDTDRHERPIARPKRLKRDDEEDDGPTYVVEDSNDTLTKAEYEAMLNGTADQTPSADVAQNVTENQDGDTKAVETPKSKQQQVASLGGASKKRKAVKIGGDADDVEGAEEEAATKSAKPEAQQNKDAKSKKLKKRIKAVKLSFGNEEEEKT
ncbi:hypothetical protein MPH_02270 [Macrophomina phaseolina MS6]|uniref:DUF4604 domain-containing protein n=1 Tax=Macrophomina phaseolina (strain MS6) TaxID=1126212 RepID=K2SDF8_MACPH|nr:hypothetical protein MPH_02270 [Macrophomina phaseolina MS6]